MVEKYQNIVLLDFIINLSLYQKNTKISFNLILKSILVHAFGMDFFFIFEKMKKEDNILSKT